MATIPFPPVEGVWQWVSAGGCLLVGCAFALWGNRFHRIALLLVGLGSGYLFGGRLAEALSVTPLWGQLAGAVTLGLLAFIGARVVWAVLATGIVLGIATHIMGSQYAQAGDAGQAATQPADLLVWAENLWQAALKNASMIRDEQGATGLMLLACAAALPLIVCMAKPQLGRVLMTAFLGAFGMVAGASMLSRDLWNAAAAGWRISVAAVGAVMLIGVALQYRQILATERSDSADGHEEKYKDKDSGQPKSAAEVYAERDKATWEDETSDDDD